MQGSFTILVVDDSLTQLAVLRDALEIEGYAVETASNGMEAIAKVYHSPPDLILSDVMMPELNGYHLCRLLKNDPCTARIPIILLTNLKERHDRFWGEKAGADRYLEKEADLAPILGEVATLLAQTAGRKTRLLPTAPIEIANGDIRSRVTAVLDRLLYESTISNEILQLTGLANDIDQLAREFLRFLSVICRYSMAGLVLGDGRDRHVLCLQAPEGTDAGLIEEAKLQTLQIAGLSSSQNHVRLLFVAGEKDPVSSDMQLHLLHALPIQDKGERLATLVLFSTHQERLTEGTRHALKVVADRFLIVARYLKKIKEIDEVKGDFVSMLVHDLRSPLTSIRGFTDVLSEGTLGSVTNEQSSALHNIQGGCDRLLALIEDILDLSKLEAGKMLIHTGPLPVRPLTERICADLSALLMEKNQELQIDIPAELPWVMADGKQLSRVLANLLTNAIKFTPHGGKISVSARQVEECAATKLKNCLMVSVSDTGPGIPPEQQRKLFSRYQQLPEARVFRKGTGLGLAICKEIILLHKGDIWVESPISEEGGSRFSFVLPAAE